MILGLRRGRCMGRQSRRNGGLDESADRDGVRARQWIADVWESYGRGGVPLIVAHGGFGLIGMFGELIDELAERRRVIAVELQGHGHTRDIDRPFSYEAFGDDLARAAEHLGLERVDLLGYSLGASCCLWAAISTPGSLGGWPLSPCRSAVTAGSPRFSPPLTRWAAPALPR